MLDINEKDVKQGILIAGAVTGGVLFADAIRPVAKKGGSIIVDAAGNSWDWFVDLFKDEKDGKGKKGKKEAA